MRFLAKLLPFFYLGIMIVVLVAGLVIFSYLLIFGAIVGLVLFVLAWLREKFFAKPQKKSVEEKQGRVIDHDKL